MSNCFNIAIDSHDFHLLFNQEQIDKFDPQFKKIAQSFLEDKWEALFVLGMKEEIDFECPTLHFLQKVAVAFITDLTHQPSLEILRERIQIKPSADRVETLLSFKPFIKEAHFITKEWLQNIYSQLQHFFAQKISDYPGRVKKFLNEFNQDLTIAESIFFHLVENPENGRYPFAFLATYAKKLEDGRIQQAPLLEILEEYKENPTKVMDLLNCLNAASDFSPLISQLMVSGELFHPLGLTVNEAYEFLKEVPTLEKLGIVCRIPNWWKKKSNSIVLNVKVGENKSALFGLNSLISLKPELRLDDQKLTQADIRKILESSGQLLLIKGKWIEANPKKLQALLDLMETMPREVTLQQALQQEIHLPSPESDPDLEKNIQISHGKWLNAQLQKLTNPSIIRKTNLPKGLQATLRPYQIEGYNWLNALFNLGFGALLADDMGLGKTLQVLAWLMKEYQRDPKKKALIIVPASLLGNWKKEIEKFTPELTFEVLHSRSSVKDFSQTPYEKLPFLTITTYNMSFRIEHLREHCWDFLILDEAQAIKNPLTKQAQTIKSLKAQKRLAMTGTPIENNLINLWSIFDFLNSGLLGSLNEFKKFMKNSKGDPQLLNKLQTIISPFLLRRLKSDKSIIQDLPDKIEQNDYIELSEKQKVLYHQVIDQLAKSLEEDQGENPFQRSALVLKALMQLKQICNHPDQYLGQQAYAFKDSGKFKMLKEIGESIAANHECVLVFTQFREMVEPLNRELEKIFGCKGLVLHGQTPVREREKIVKTFNDQKVYIPYMVLTVKAAGIGLNLTQANHVIHFDRWWNPAVENQATDRAYRIGQHKNVMVHKFVCLQTLEESIDKMLQDKQNLADSIIQSSSESWLTSLSDQELLDILKLQLIVD